MVYTVVLQHHVTQLRPKKIVIKNKDCAFKLLKGHGFGDNIPPENRCVKVDYKDTTQLCQFITEKEMCNNTMSTDNDLRKINKQNATSDCVWKNEKQLDGKDIYQCGFKKKDVALVPDPNKPFTDKFIFKQ